jgi:serine/threonine protein kinase
VGSLAQPVSASVREVMQNNQTSRGNRPVALIQPDGSVLIRGKTLRFPNLKATSVIGRGANGVVIRSQHSFLNKDIAIKIWLTLKEGDIRDKFYQGMNEAKKMSILGHIEGIIRIYDAGETSGYFYATMDYYPGITAKFWLENWSPPLRSRLWLARGTLLTLSYATEDGAVHGDPHLGNILVKDPVLKETRQSTTKDRIPEFMIVDFGTSHFTRREVSVVRHWRVLHRTIKMLLRPLDIDRMWSHQKDPRLLDPATNARLADLLRAKWYYDFFDEIHPMLVSIGAYWVSKKEIGSYPYPDERVRRELERLVQCGELRLDRATLGEGWVRDD